MQASPHPHPLGPGPTLGGVLEDDYAQLRSTEGHLGML